MSEWEKFCSIVIEVEAKYSNKKKFAGCIGFIKGFDLRVLALIYNYCLSDLFELGSIRSKGNYTVFTSSIF